LVPRALPANAPHGYVPQTNACPSNTPSIRNATDLSDEELAWLPVRRNATVQPMRDFLGRLNITGLDTNKYIDDHANNASALPNIAIAASGGGYRAMLNGAGVVQAFDSRTENSTGPGQLGGLLQSTTYLAGLSGGSWLVGSLYTNNFSSISDILGYGGDGSSLWQFENSIFEGPKTGSIQILDSVGYYVSIRDSVEDKGDAGFDTTFTDYWGRALSYQLINATNGGPEYTFSSIAAQQWFQDAEAPMPLIVADGRAPGELLIAANTTVYEFNPWEMGSHDPTVFGFAPMKYLGTNFTAGAPNDNDKCVTGFDACSFIMGTSSSLFNQGLLLVNSSESSGPFSDALQSVFTSVLERIGRNDDDIADYPNPFYGWNNRTNPNHNSTQLTLVDGGEDNQNIPLNPLIQPARHVDVIFAIDSSADTNETWPTANSATGWPNGASLQATYRRSLETIQNYTAFPSIPSVTTFQNLGLNAGPTFFGCDPTNTSTDGTGTAPLIVYLPNAPYVYNSNVSTFDPDYNVTERNAIVANGYEGATQGNGTLDENWATCVGCAVLSRSLYRTGTEVPEVCNQCFQKYCWSGEISQGEMQPYVPAMKLEDERIDVASGAARVGGVFGAVVVGVVVAVVNTI
jgi:lysophospholipase